MVDHTVPRKKILKSEMELYIKMVKLRLRLFKQTPPRETNNVLKKSLSYMTDMNIYLSIMYILDGKYWNPNEVNVDEIFAYSATLNMIVENEDR